MRGRIVFLLEEPSMKHLLSGLLPRVFPGWQEHIHFLCIAHQGKGDLRISIPRKLRAWQSPNDRFVIVQDQDRSDCESLKQSLMDHCIDAGRRDALIRIVCKELESWYLGDLEALAEEFSDASLLHKSMRKKFANPDNIEHPSRWLENKLSDFQKISAAERMSRRLSVETNSSHSFSVFIYGIQRIAAEME